jgi:hypothetical protein
MKDGWGMEIGWELEWWQRDTVHTDLFKTLALLCADSTLGQLLGGSITASRVRSQTIFPQMLEERMQAKDG